jgi:hypothetical protein
MTSLIPKGTYRLRSGDPNSPNAYLARETDGPGTEVVVEQLDASSDSQKVHIHRFFFPLCITQGTIDTVGYLPCYRWRLHDHRFPQRWLYLAS